MIRLRRILRLSSTDGASFSVMVGVGESYVAAFALALGLSVVSAGLIASLPLVAGGLLQLASPFGIVRFGGYRRWTVLCAIVQAASFIPLIAAALWPAVPANIIFVAATMYWAAGMAASASWNAWVGSLIPTRVRSHYFGRRQSMMNAAGLVGLIAGGLWLNYCGADATVGFVPLFAAAFVARCVSASALAAHPSAPAKPVRLRDMLHSAWDSEQRSWMLWVVFAHGAVNIAGPFLTPFLLVELDLSYAEFMILTAAVFVAKSVSLPALGRASRKLGPDVLMACGGLGVAALPLLWTLSSSFWFMLGLQVLSGLAWAAFEIAAQLGFMNMACERDRMALLSMFNALNSIAVAAAAVLGGIILSSLGGDHSAYVTVFIVSFSARLVAAFGLMSRVHREILAILPIPLQVLAIRPWGGGGIMRPVTAAIPVEKPRRPSTDHARSHPVPARSDDGPSDPDQAE